jgi:hypothetical protein
MINLPVWTKDFKCPLCNKIVCQESIKEIGIYGFTNVPVSRYKIGNKMGNVFVGILCEHCSFFGPVMLDTQFAKIEQFTDLLLNCESIDKYEKLVLFGV